ncbi:MAG TPA: hypothetical protein VNY07_05985 [Chthoniobacterales bacterium]|jgi:predicted GH43/DUF377 family glycosyl hydrolase|nr:hypothetical protein [Chthoniobacterales bacterium]
MKAFALAVLWPAMILSAAESSPWKIDTQPALAPGMVGEWDDWAIASPTILKAAGKWWMFYEGVRFDHDGLQRGGGIAVSENGVTWTKHTQNPLFSPALKEVETWSSPSVAHWKDKFWLVYLASDDPFRREKQSERFDPVPGWFRVASSEDGLTWDPVRGAKPPRGSADYFPIRPSLYAEETALHLWWIGLVGEQDRALFHSVSRDGETWSMPNQQPAKELDSREICCARVYPSGDYYILTYVAFDEKKQQHFVVTKISRNARSWAAQGPPEFLLESHWMHSPPTLLFQPDGARLFYSAKEPDETVALRSAWCSKTDYVSH